MSHLTGPNINQEIYGLPCYVLAIPSALLNESATLFRRKYYLNGSHARFHHVYDRSGAEPEGCGEYLRCHEKYKSAGQFPQFFYV